MKPIQDSAALRYLIIADRQVTIQLNQLSRWRSIRRFFQGHQ